MKPGDHPEFFRLAPPEGTSRESTIRLDADGRFWHDGGLVENDALARALHSWISRHPDDGRFILTNGYDWTYFQVDDVPFLITSVSVHDGSVEVRLSDGTSEDLPAEGWRVAADGALYVPVKGGVFEARFTRHAQTSLAPVVEEDEHGSVAVRVGSVRVVPSQRT